MTDTDHKPACILTNDTADADMGHFSGYGLEMTASYRNRLAVSPTALQPSTQSCEHFLSG